jgi:putative membrane protein insertion efficiency factor
VDRFRPNDERFVDDAMSRAVQSWVWRMTRILQRVAQLPRSAGIGLIKAYRLVLSPWIGRSCRYLPTCSEYTEEAIGRYGLWAGSWMGLARFQRCGPFGASGYDPVPEEIPAGAAWYRPWRYGRWTGRHIHPHTRLDR